MEKFGKKERSDKVHENGDGDNQLDVFVRHFS